MPSLPGLSFSFSHRTPARSGDPRRSRHRQGISTSYLDGIFIELQIGGNDGQVFHNTLRNDDTVEWVAVMMGKFSKFEKMGNSNRYYCYVRLEVTGIG